MAWVLSTVQSLHHSDRGSQYASEDYRAVLQKHGAAQIPADFKVRFLEYHWTVNHRKWAYVR
jgi:transposase InsO family protein